MSSCGWDGDGDGSCALRSLYSAGSPEDLMEESADETQRREDMLKMLKLSKDALKIICMCALQTECAYLFALDTSSAPLPPSPPKNDMCTRLQLM